MNVKNTELLMHFLGTYCDVNALGPDWQGKLNRTLENLKDQARSEQFKEELLLAIDSDTVSAVSLENATGWVFDSEEEKIKWFAELWKCIFGTDPKA